MFLDCRLEIEAQIVSKDPKKIEHTQLEAALYHLDPTDPSNARLVREETVGTFSNDHWVSVDTTNKRTRDAAWYGGLVKVTHHSVFPHTQAEDIGVCPL